MKLEGQFFISKDKLINYLLQWRPVNDKSRFLAFAGYTLENWETLLRDIEEHSLTLDFKWQDEDEYGTFYALIGVLAGPNGKELSVKTIWMKEHSSSLIRFITLIPQQP